MTFYDRLLLTTIQSRVSKKGGWGT